MTKHKRTLTEVERYRLYTDEKNNLPPTLTPKEYEAAIKRLADKYRI